MTRPKDIPHNFWDYLRRGLYALKSEAGGIYGERWEFVTNGDVTDTELLFAAGEPVWIEIED